MIPIIKALGIEYELDTTVVGDNVNRATLVRLFNVGLTANTVLITVSEADGIVIKGSITLAGNVEMFLRKLPGELIFADNTNVMVTPVSF